MLVTIVDSRAHGIVIRFAAKQPDAYHRYHRYYDCYHYYLICCQSLTHHQACLNICVDTCLNTCLNACLTAQQACLNCMSKHRSEHMSGSSSIRWQVRVSSARSRAALLACRLTDPDRTCKPSTSSRSQPVHSRGQTLCLLRRPGIQPLLQPQNAMLACRRGMSSCRRKRAVQFYKIDLNYKSYSGVQAGLNGPEMKVLLSWNNLIKLIL